MLARSRIAAAATLLLCATAFADEEADAVRAPPAPSVERGVAVVQCTAEGPEGRRAHGAIIDTGIERPPREAILTVAHALPPSADAVRSDCVVIGDRGRVYVIEQAWIGTGGRDSDWAVLLTDERMRGNDVARLRTDANGAAKTPAELMGARAQVRLLHGGGEAVCEIRMTKWLTRPELDAGLYGHSCASWRGLSGSPMVLATSGGDVLVGIHLGGLSMEPDTDGAEAESAPLPSLGQGLDGPLAEALAEAAASAATR